MTAGLTEKIKYGFTKDKDMQRMHILFLCLYRQARRMRGACICPGYGAAPPERMSGCARCEKPGKAGAACPEEEE